MSKHTRKTTISLIWRRGQYGNERVVQCCGCGVNIAVSQSRVAGPVGGPALFSCGVECEERFESTPQAVLFIASLSEAERERFDYEYTNPTNYSNYS
jgi:hypothetical protein